MIFIFFVGVSKTRCNRMNRKRTGGHRRCGYTNFIRVNFNIGSNNTFESFKEWVFIPEVFIRTTDTWGTGLDGIGNSSKPP